MKNKFSEYTSSLKGRITLMFVLLAFLIEGTIALYWVYSLRPRIETDMESDIKALVQTQSYSISRLLSERKVNKEEVIKAIDELFLLKDPETETPFVSGVELIMDYETIDFPEGSLDISRWQHLQADNEKENFYNVEIPLFSDRTKELLGIARFHGSKYSFQRFEKKVKKSFIIITFGTMVMLFAGWLILLFLLKPLHLLAESLKTRHIRDIEPVKNSGRMVSSEIRSVDMKLSELFGKINSYTSELETLNTILFTQQETSIDGIIVVNSEGKILTYNKRFLDMWGIPDEILREASGSYLLKKVKEKMSNPGVFQDQIRHFADNPGVKGFKEIELSDGSIFECYSSPMEGAERNFIGRVWYFRDISARRKAEKSLWESEERHRLFLQNFVGIAYQADKESLGFALVHGRVKEISGYDKDEIINKKITWKDLIHPNDFDNVMEEIVRLQNTPDYVADNEYRICRKNGSIKWIRNICSVVKPESGASFIQGAFYDITKSKQLESQLQQSRKMESIGTLAGGITHDFNNILGIILGNAELTKEYLTSEGEPADEFIREIIIACERAKNMVAQILAFSRKGDQEFAPININNVVQESATLIRSSIPATVSISTNIQDEENIIIGDKTQMSQVMLNLCANSAHAMRDTGGTLDISVFAVDPEDKSLKQYYDLEQNEYVEIKVSDSGHGIRQEIIDRIFDPYFTTKNVGEGSGMGLAVVHGIVTNHKGKIRISSKAGQGTTVRMIFPKVDDRPEEEEKSSGILFGGDERVLVVDDEEGIVIMFNQLFKRLGYTVTTGTDPVEVYEMFKKNPDAFDLLITDMAMPELSGYDLAQKVKELKPDMQIILCTGYSELIDEEKAMDLGISKYIMKPLSLFKVAETVRNVLDEKKH